MKQVITAILLLLTLNVAYSQETKVEENEQKINSLKEELIELDKLLDTYKAEEKEQRQVLDSADLDEGTKDYIQQVVQQYMATTGTARSSEIDYLKGQLDMMRKSMNELRTEVATSNASLTNEIGQVGGKLDELNNNDNSGEVNALRAEVAGLKAKVSMLSEGKSVASGSEGEIIAQQKEEIELLKTEVKRLRQELEASKQQVRFTSSEEFKKLKEQNEQYKQTIQAQQKQMDLLKEKMGLMQEQIDRDDELAEMSQRLDELARSVEKDESDEMTVKNRAQIEQSMDKLDVLEAKNDANKKIEELSEEVSQLKTIVARGKVIENTNDPMFMSNNYGNYYVIIASRRSYENILMAQQDYRNQGIKTAIVQNDRKSWYHLFPQRFETREQAGEAVGEFRENGFDDAWWLYKKD